MSILPRSLTTTFVASAMSAALLLSAPGRTFTDRLLLTAQSAPVILDAHRTLDREELLGRYHGANRAIALDVHAALSPTDVILLPPRDLLRRYFPEEDVHWAEPKYIWRAAGPIHGLMPEVTDDLSEATHAVLITDLGLRVMPISDAGGLARVLRHYGSAPR